MQHPVSSWVRRKDDKKKQPPPRRDGVVFFVQKDDNKTSHGEWGFQKKSIGLQGA